MARESVRGAFPAMIASTIGGASRDRWKIIGNLGFLRLQKTLNTRILWDEDMARLCRMTRRWRKSRNSLTKCNTQEKVE